MLTVAARVVPQPGRQRLDEIDEYRQDVDEFDGEIASGSEPE